jgi:type I restriction enzyme, S subunit
MKANSKENNQAHQANPKNNVADKWEMKKLGEVCDLSAGGDVPKNNFSELETKEFNIPIYANGEKNNGLYGYTNIAKISKPSITVSARGTIGFSVKRTEPFFPIVRLIVITPKNEQLDLTYLNYGISKIDFKHSGTSIPQLTVPMIKNYEIPVPPLAEQQRIVAYLDQTFAALNQAKANTLQNLQNAKELFETALKNVFENKGEGWEEKSLGVVGKVCMCKRILKEQTLPVGDIPFYKIGTFGKTPNAFIAKEVYQEYIDKYSFPKKGDILISASGTIGRCVIYDGKPAYFQDSNIVWIDNKENQVSNSYLNLFYDYCDWNPSKGATISRLYNDDLRRIIIHFPKSLQTQQEIVTKLDALKTQTQQLESLYQTKLNNIEELRSGILQRAFENNM